VDGKEKEPGEQIEYSERDVIAMFVAKAFFKASPSPSTYKAIWEE